MNTVSKAENKDVDCSVFEVDLNAEEYETLQIYMPFFRDKKFIWKAEEAIREQCDKKRRKVLLQIYE